VLAAIYKCLKYSTILRKQYSVYVSIVYNTLAYTLLDSLVN